MESVGSFSSEVLMYREIFLAETQIISDRLGVVRDALCADGFRGSRREYHRNILKRVVNAALFCLSPTDSTEGEIFHGFGLRLRLRDFTDYTDFTNPTGQELP